MENMNQKGSVELVAYELSKKCSNSLIFFEVCCAQKKVKQKCRFRRGRWDVPTFGASLGRSLVSESSCIVSTSIDFYIASKNTQIANIKKEV